MTRPKRKVTSSKVPQKVALPAYRFSPSKSPSADESPQPSASDSNRDASTPPASVDQEDGDDPNESGTDQSHSTTTSSSGDFPRLPVRPRQRFTADETTALEQVYRRNKRPPNEIKQRLSRKFNTSVSRIQIWFQNRRAKEKKNNNSSSNSQRASAADDEQDHDSNESEQPEPSTSTAASSSSSKRQKALAASPPAVADSSTTAARKRKRQKVPTTTTVSAPIPATHSYLPSGSYTLAYPGFVASSMQPIDHQGVVANPSMPSENFLYQGHPSSHPRAAGFFVPNSDWRHPHFIHPSYAQAFTGPHPTEKPTRYVDPKKVVKPEPPQPVLDHMGEQGTTSTSRSASRKGKQKQRDTGEVGLDAEQGSSGERTKGEL